MCVKWVQKIPESPQEVPRPQIGCVFEILAPAAPGVGVGHGGFWGVIYGIEGHHVEVPR